MMAGLQSECFFYLVRVLKLNSLGITQAGAVTLNTLAFFPLGLLPMACLKMK